MRKVNYRIFEKDIYEKRERRISENVGKDKNQKNSDWK